MVDMTTVRKTVGKKVVITGNIDPIDVLKRTPDSIRETILNIYKEVGNPYMVNAGCEIPAGTPVENLKALCEPISYCP